MCKICINKIHLRCSAIKKWELSHLNKNWFCKWCLTDNLPFCNMDNKKFANLLTPKVNYAIPDNAIAVCRICTKGNIIKNSATFCKMCKHLFHKQCLPNENEQTIDFCSKCWEESLPFLMCTDEEIHNDNFNSINICQPCLNLNEAEINLKFKSSELLNIFDNTQKDSFCQIESDEINELNNIDFKYYDTHKFHSMSKKIVNDNFSLLHTNIESLCAKEDKLKLLITNLDYSFDVIALSETWNQEESNHKSMPPK